MSTGSSRTSWTPPAAGSSTRLWLVRHGSTEHSPLHVFSGRNDLPLSDLGQGQAAGLAQRFAPLLARNEITSVVSSPLLRARETAQAIAGGRDVEVMEDLAELDFGAWEGLSGGQVREQWPEEFGTFTRGDGPAPGGESFADVLTRVTRAEAELLARYERGRVLVLSHVTVIKSFLRLALDAPQSALFRIHLDPASVSAIDYIAAANMDGSAGVSVRLVNDVSHLA